MTKLSPIEDRAAGALMGAFIGDALALGPHWYYNLDEQRKDYGNWITDYTKPKPGRYHDKMAAGDNSQAGYILKLLLSSLEEEGKYNQNHFCRLLDTNLFERIDGTPDSGPGGYTSQSIRKAYQARVKEGKSWQETGNNADTTESIERALALAVRYCMWPKKMAEVVTSNALLTQNDELVVSMTVAYCAVLGYLVEGHKLTPDISSALMKRVEDGQMPFHSFVGEKNQDANVGVTPQAGHFASPDALLSPGYMATAAQDKTIKIEPAWKVSIVYGMPCAIYHQLPAVYYLSARFSDDMESAVLHAVNGGGQNQARAMLTAALVGAQTGLSNIPSRWLDGLNDRDRLLSLCSNIARHVTTSL